MLAEFEGKIAEVFKNIDDNQCLPVGILTELGNHKSNGLIDLNILISC